MANGRPIKNMIGVVMNRLVGMGLKSMSRIRQSGPFDIDGAVVADN